MDGYPSFSTSPTMQRVAMSRPQSRKNSRSPPPFNHELPQDRRLPRSNLHRHLTHSPRFQRSHKVKPGHQYCDHDHCVGAEPGINPRSGTATAEYSHFKQSCVIDIIDYDSDEATFTRMGNDQFIHLMSQPPSLKSPSEVAFGEVDPTPMAGTRPPLCVRWINIGGIDWEVLKSIAMQYELHSLALEDILHESGHNHSKADYYPEHLFIRVLCHIVGVEDDEDSGFDLMSGEFVDVEVRQSTPSPNAAERGESSPSKTHVDSGSSEEPMRRTGTHATSTSKDGKLSQTGDSDSSDLDAGKDKDLGSPPKKSRRRRFITNAKNALQKRLTSLSGFHSPARRELIARIEELKKEDRVSVQHRPLFIFLLRNGTVISITPNANLDYATPIVERLHQSDSGLRTSDDASLLVESLLDLVVDRVLEVMDEYQAKIHRLEHQILMHPSMHTVRSFTDLAVHILSGDLIMHKRTLDPIKTMINGLRRYDLDRCIALADSLELAKQQEAAQEAQRKHHGKRGKKGRSSKVDAAVNLPTGHSTEHDPRLKSDDDHLRDIMRAQATKPGQKVVQGYFSYKSKVYLADVYDHMDFALTSLDMFSGISENLINYAFNTASYEMNIVVNRLTVVSIIFLPLTLLTGYFGMNFTPFWSVDQNSDAFFWKAAGPMMVVLIPMFMFTEFKEFFVYLKRRWQDRQAIKHLLRTAQQNKFYGKQA
ncbi:hypothetical protein FA15DRAFT_656030 [Coprinopsis marcescibilis]|uniref:Cora-domain-containing protein n=1 Tax=Coprinopsis marcescibilis TaxID=230819 RepID=A0A5C3KUS3_COPMA|nr:hypothetical protein FA15DRAFT_656030 [Coprinopsis marcescibilis]